MEAGDTSKKLLKHKRKNSPNIIEDPIENQKEPKDKNNTRISMIRNNKKPHRKKLLKNKLEFFLSDINLYHDNYLKRIYMSNNKSISPEIFLKFNSIKSLLSDIEKTDKRKNEIIKAIEISKTLSYNKASDKITRNKQYDEKLIDTQLYDECTIFISNLPICINHQIIYDIFDDFKILYISLFKKKVQDKKVKQAYIIFKNKDDVQKTIAKYNNVELPDFKIIKSPLHIESKMDMKKREEQNKKEKEQNNSNINNQNNKNEILANNPNVIVIEKSRLTDPNISENMCMSFTGLKEDIKLFVFINYLSKLQRPLFVDLDRSKNTAILRFGSKNEIDTFLKNFYSGGAEILKNMFKFEKVTRPRVFTPKENLDYLEVVKQKMQQFKEKKGRTK